MAAFAQFVKFLALVASLAASVKTIVALARLAWTIVLRFGRTLTLRRRFTPTWARA